MSHQNPLLYNAYDEQLSFLDNKVWAKRVVRFVARLGFGNLLLNFNHEIYYKPLVIAKAPRPIYSVM